MYRTNPPLFVRLVLSDCFRELVTTESLHTHYAPQQTRLQLQRKWEKGGGEEKTQVTRSQEWADTAEVMELEAAAAENKNLFILVHDMIKKGAFQRAFLKSAKTL